MSVSNGDQFVTKTTETRDVFVSGAHRSSGAGRGHPEDISPYFTKRLAMLLERGAAAHGALNYAQGMGIKRSLQAIERHTWQFKMGDTSEDHLAAIAFNVMTIIHTLEGIKMGCIDPSLNDMPSFMPPKRWPSAEELQKELEKPVEDTSNFLPWPGLEATSKPPTPEDMY